MRTALLIIDFNNMFFRSMEVSGMNLMVRGMSTKGVYGFIRQFCANILAIKPKDVVVCTDTRPYLRSKLLPSYKEDRRERFGKGMTTTELKKRLEQIQFNRQLCEEFLETMDVFVYGVQGLEADDLIATLCNRYNDTYKEVIIVSNDTDLYQLLVHDNVFIKRKVKTKYILYSIKDFIKEYDGISIDEYVKVLAMAGTHNGVPGIKRIGETTALKIIRDTARYEEVYKQNKTDMDLFERLIRLPFAQLKSPKIHRPDYNERAMLRFMNRYDIDLTQHMRDAFTFIGG